MKGAEAGVSAEGVERTGLILGGMMTLGSLPLWSAPLSAGVVLGSLLALLNFRWLKRLVRSLALSSRRRLPRLLLAAYLLKYLFSGVVIFVAIKYDAVNVAALLAGVSVVFLAICWEGARAHRRPKEGANHAAEF